MFKKIFIAKRKNLLKKQKNISLSLTHLQEFLFKNRDKNSIIPLINELKKKQKSPVLYKPGV